MKELKPLTISFEDIANEMIEGKDIPTNALTLEPVTRERIKEYVSKGGEVLVLESLAAITNTHYVPSICFGFESLFKDIEGIKHIDLSSLFAGYKRTKPSIFTMKEMFIDCPHLEKVTLFEALPGMFKETDLTGMFTNLPNLETVVLPVVDIGNQLHNVRGYNRISTGLPSFKEIKFI